MLTVHRLLSTWNNLVDNYIALTNYDRAKFIEGGLPAEKIIVKPNIVYPDPGVGEGEGGYALFVGRLSVEKGLDTLLEAWQTLASEIPLKIVGDGPLAKQVKQASDQLPQVEWLGYKPLTEVCELMGQAKFLVYPSKWNETFSRVAVEAFAKGTPVIAAAGVTAMSELVEPGRTGLHFPIGDATQLVQQVRWLLAHPEQLKLMRIEARREFEARFHHQENYRQLLAIYLDAIALSPGKLSVNAPCQGQDC
jgi:glycosyltransferase involved in cell wall biosynthesis